MKNEKPNVEKIHSKSHRKLGRRGFAKALASLGFSGIAINHLTVDDVKAASKDEVPIVIGFRREQKDDLDSKSVPIKKYVPADWYSDLLHARNVYDNASFENIPGVIATSIRAGKFGGRNSFVNVGIEKGEEEKTKGKIPDQIKGVKVRKEIVGRPSLNLCNASDQGSNIPEGSQVEREAGGYGTLSTLTKNGYRYFSSSEHIWHGDDITSETMYHPNVSSEDEIGSINYANCEKDFVAAAPINSHTPTFDIGGTNYTVIGQYSKDGIDSLIAANETGKKTGVRTCTTSGDILASDGYIGPVDKGCWFRYHQVKGNWNADNGDSGAPTYHEVNNGDVMMLSMHGGIDPLNGDSFGFSAYHIRDATGYQFY